MTDNRETRYADVVIAGGGASGLAAAIELGVKAPELDVLVIEKMPEPGRKIRATGSGRCNISNTAAEKYGRIKAFFGMIGLVTKEYENGLVYPHSESAADVATLLTDRAKSLGVRFACGEEVMAVRTAPASLLSGPLPGSSNLFQLESVMKSRDGMRSIVTQCSFLIMATGGKAGPTYGTIGDGYRIAKNLGHSIVAPVPALTGIECAEWSAGAAPCAVALGGTRSAGVVSLYRSAPPEAEKDREEGGGSREAASAAGPEKIFEEAGEVQFTKYGLSGICVFNMTRHMRYDRKAGGGPGDFLVKIDLFPGRSISEYIKERRDGAFSDAPVGEVLRAVLKEPLARYIIDRSSGGDPGFADLSIESLRDEEVGRIADNVHALSFHPASLRGWNDAQVTMGGVSLREIDASSAESLVKGGLYITGELADRDFPCGGYNLSNAWTTGLAAADDIAGKVRQAYS